MKRPACNQSLNVLISIFHQLSFVCNRNIYLKKNYYENNLFLRMFNQFISKLFCFLDNFQFSKMLRENMTVIYSLLQIKNYIIIN